MRVKMSTSYWCAADYAANEFRDMPPMVLARMITTEEKVIADAERAKSAVFRTDRREWLRQLCIARTAIAR